MKKNIVFLLLVFSSCFSLLAQEIQGNYQLLAGKKAPNAKSLEKVQVTEVFSFTCPHCYFFQKNLPGLKEKFGEKLEINHIPIGFSGINPAKLYFIALEEGKGEEVKKLIFQTFHDSGVRNINHQAIIARLAKISKIEQAYEEKKDSKEILERIKFAQFYINGKNIKSTPSFIIEDSILVTGANIENLTKVLESLLKETE